MNPVRVEVWRGSLVESWHEVSGVAVDAHGRLEWMAGDPQLLTMTRSAIKAWQALPLVESGACDSLGVTEQELALCCASHSAEPFHVAAVRSLLSKVGVGEEMLACGPHAPLDVSAARALSVAGQVPGRVHNNCSGKHAGMLALARHHGWPLDGYQHPVHPVQQRMLEEVARWTGLSAEVVSTAVDGCGVVTYSVPLARLAQGTARFASAAGVAGSGASRVVGAMTRHPQYVAGTGRVDTALMAAAGERLFAKGGADGVYCVGLPQAGLGIALKVHDGAGRAAAPALLAVLGALGLVSSQVLETLADYAEPVLKNTRGEAIGRIRVAWPVLATTGSSS
jgi:L-asparaginase II